MFEEMNATSSARHVFDLDHSSIRFMGINSVGHRQAEVEIECFSDQNLAKGCLLLPNR